MYDVLFIDDKFEEIRDTYSDFQSQHIRCFYSDGEHYLPKNDKERLPFKNLKYISLDLHLENRGITKIKDNKTALSTLVSVIQSFVSDGVNVTIIANTSFPKDFDENNFFKYLNFNTNPKIEKKAKNNKKSSLHTNMQAIAEQTCQEILRNVVIRNAIEIENIILEKVKNKFDEIACSLSNKKLEKIKKFDFKSKINLFNLTHKDQELINKLNKLRELRNDCAHGNSPLTENLLDFLESVENLKQEVTS